MYVYIYIYTSTHPIYGPIIYLRFVPFVPSKLRCRSGLHHGFHGAGAGSVLQGRCFLSWEKTTGKVGKPEENHLSKFEIIYKKVNLASGKHTKKSGKSPSFVGKLTRNDHFQ